MRSHLILTLLSATLTLSSQTRQISKSGTAFIPAGGNQSPSGTLSVNEFPPGEEHVNRLIPRASYSTARVPSDHVPTPASSSFASLNPGLFGFLGLTHADQRLAGTGVYANSQFSLEPPDQALCTGNGYILEGVNSAFRVFNTSGTPLSPTINYNQFFGLPPRVIRTVTPNVFGDRLGDPRCHFDAPTQRWFMTVFQADSNPATGAFTGPTAVLLAVSASSSPLGAWNLYRLNTTNDGTGGTPKHKSCPCFGDQPLIGADANGFYISTNEFETLGDAFNGTQLYAFSKAKLAAGLASPVVHIDVGALATPDPGGIWYTLQPATAPPGGAFETARGGAEYFVSALEFFNNGLDNRLAVWALTNTSSLNTATPDLSLSMRLIDTEVYGFPPAGEQADGPRPFAESFGSPKEKLELLSTNDDRLQQVVFAAGKLWGGLNTVVKTENGPSRAGIAWFIVTPSLSGSGLSATVTKNGYLAVNREHVMYPSIGVNPAGQGVMTFTLTGPERYPSAAYATIDAVNGVGPIHVAAPGAAPEDGFTGYVAIGGSGRVARWGDYSAAAVDESGNVWMAVEYIPNAPRTAFANWGTFISRLIQ